MLMRYQIDNALWFKLNATIRYLMIHSCSSILPLYIVNEYPKSGGSWVGQMLSEALDVPFPRNQLPYFKESILHTHTLHSWNTNNVVVVCRDGRDIAISLYYHSLFKNDRGNSRLVDICRKDLSFSDYHDLKHNLPRFIEYMFIDKKHPGFSWVDFVNKWINCPNCIFIKYESLRKNTLLELSRIFYELKGVALNESNACKIIEKYSFEKLSGRKVGEENKQSFLRKGTIGDWQNHFSVESKDIFNSYAGQALIDLDYEKNSNWSFS